MTRPEAPFKPVLVSYFSALLALSVLLSVLAIPLILMYYVTVLFYFVVTL